jgi:hypothetical protein
MNLGILLYYRFIEVRFENGKVIAVLEKMADSPSWWYLLLGMKRPNTKNSIIVWETEKGCREILDQAAGWTPQDYETRYIVREMKKALNAMAVYKRKHHLAA